MTADGSRTRARAALSPLERQALVVDRVLSGLRTDAVLGFRWWRPSWQAGYEAGLRAAHEGVTEALAAEGAWTPAAGPGPKARER